MFSLPFHFSYKKFRGSGSGLDQNSINQVSGPVSGSGSRRAKMIHKNRKKFGNFMFWSAGCSFLRAKGSFCSLNVLCGGLGIGIHPKMLDPVPNQMNTDPKHWLQTVRYFLCAKFPFFAERTKNSCLEVDGNGATLDIRMSVGVVDHVGNLFRSQPLGPTHGEEKLAFNVPVVYMGQYEVVLREDYP